MKWRSAGAGLVIGAICLVLAVRQVQPGHVAAALRGAQPGLLALGALLVAAAMALRARRWQALFQPAERVSFGGALSATYIGYLANSLLPGRVGELLRAYLIGQSDGASNGRALGTIFVEKLLDVLVLLGVLGAVALRVPLPAWAARGALTVAAGGALAAALFAALARAREPAVAWCRAWIDPLPLIRRLAVSQLLDTGLRAADGLTSLARLLAQAALSVALWATSAAALYAVMSAFGLDVPPAAAALVLAVTNLGMTVPSAPAYIGVYHLLAIETLRLFGVDQSAALSYAVAMHALTFGGFVLGGLGFLWRRHLAFGALWFRAGSSPGGAPAFRQAGPQPARTG